MAPYINRFLRPNFQRVQKKIRPSFTQRQTLRPYAPTGSSRRRMLYKNMGARGLFGPIRNMQKRELIQRNRKKYLGKVALRKLRRFAIGNFWTRNNTGQ